MNYSIKREDSNFLLLKLFLILSPICDLLTGICIFKLDMPEGFIGSPSQIYRLIFLFVLFFRINKRQVRICIILLLWMLFVESTCFFYINNPLPFISGLNYATKIVFLLLLYFFVKIVIESGTPILKILHVFLFAAFLYALGIIISAILGIGVSSYTEGTFGQKGLYASGNALGIFMGIASVLCVLKKKKTFIDICKSLILLLSLLLLATKTALLFFIVTVLFFISTRKIYNKILLLCLFAGSIFYFWDYLTEAFLAVFDVVVFRYEISDSPLAFMLSSRDNYVIDAFTEFYNSSLWVLKLIIGGGVFMSYRAGYFEDMSFKQLEMDFFDVFFMYGLIGIFCYIGIIFWCIRKSYNKGWVLFSLVMFFILHSALAGHILFDGVPMTAGVILVNILDRRKEVQAEFKI